MAILDKLAGLGGAVKNTFDRAFGDGGNRHEDEVDDDDDGEAAAALDVEGAWGVLGLTATATLDDVRAAARALARQAHPATVDKEASALTAFARIASAAELLEEHLLPLSPAVAGSSTSKGSSTTTPTSTRTRATARTPR
jgi:hypothetical protein